MRRQDPSPSPALAYTLVSMLRDELQHRIIEKDHNIFDTDGCGACGLAASATVQLIRMYAFENVKFVVGHYRLPRRGVIGEHAWVRWGSYIIDPTASQIENPAFGRVLVARRNSSFAKAYVADMMGAPAEAHVAQWGESRPAAHRAAIRSSLSATVRRVKDALGVHPSKP